MNNKKIGLAFIITGLILIAFNVFGNTEIYFTENKTVSAIGLSFTILGFVVIYIANNKTAKKEINTQTEVPKQETIELEEDKQEINTQTETPKQETIELEEDKQKTNAQAEIPEQEQKKDKKTEEPKPTIQEKPPFKEEPPKEPEKPEFKVDVAKLNTARNYIAQDRLKETFPLLNELSENTEFQNTFIKLQSQFYDLLNERTLNRISYDEYRIQKILLIKLVNVLNLKKKNNSSSHSYGRKWK